jgi:hypothetical protein
MHTIHVEHPCGIVVMVSVRKPKTVCESLTDVHFIFSVCIVTT